MQNRARSLVLELDIDRRRLDELDIRQFERERSQNRLHSCPRHTNHIESLVRSEPKSTTELPE